MEPQDMARVKAIREGVWAEIMTRPGGKWEVRFSPDAWLLLRAAMGKRDLLTRGWRHWFRFEPESLCFGSPCCEDVNQVDDFRVVSRSS